MKKSNWEEVGVIGVDAGLCWLGDPCYIMGQDASEHPVKTWDEFCNKLWKKEEETENTEKRGTVQWDYKLGHAGLGVTVQTGWGDGLYPVYIRRNREGRIAEVKVVFDTEQSREIAEHFGLTED